MGASVRHPAGGRRGETEFGGQPTRTGKQGDWILVEQGAHPARKMPEKLKYEVREVVFRAS